MKRLSDLLQDIGQHELQGNSSVEISSIAYDSRKVSKGSLFVAISGLKSDATEFISEAILRGAVAVVSQKNPTTESLIPFVKIPDARAALAELAWSFYDHPEQKLAVIGITGTNGKTTTSTLLRSVLEFCGKKTGLVGTLGVFAGDLEIELSRTTPESADLADYFSQMVAMGCQYAVIEATSIGIDLKRTHGIPFRLAAFTNLTRDHIDYHGSMESYREAKLNLFRNLDSKNFAVINLDDPSASDFLKATNRQVLTYSLEKKADFQAINLSLSTNGISFDLESKLGKIRFETPLIGRFNASNVLCVIASSSALGFEPEQIKQALKQVKPVRGRAEIVPSNAPFNVVVDYAHTPDALEKILLTLKSVEHNRIFTVVGAGGDRDKGKRPLMAKTAFDLSDKLFLTSDNPRTENPENILDDMAAGLEKNSVFYRNADRKNTIHDALSQAEPKDIILIAGKGHETYQEINHVKHPFDDRKIVLDWLNANGYSV